MKVTIDGTSIEVNLADKNIVEVAKRARIGIPAPCYLANRKKGCCNGCVVEIDGKQEFACATKPQDGMNIIVKRNDLVQLRKTRLAEYGNGIKTGKPCKCSAPESKCG